MVQIPTSRDVAYSGTRSGRIAPNGPSVSVGAAVADAGQTLVRSAFNLQALAEREHKDVLDDRSNVVSTAMTKFLGDEEQRFLKAQDDSSESGIGFTRSYLEGWQKRADEFAKANFGGLTEDEQTRYTNTLLNRGNDLYAKADGFESKQKGAYYDRTTNQNLDTIRTQIRSNAANYGELKEQGLASINATNMPEAWKAERRSQWDADAAESKWRWKFTQDPDKAVRQMRGISVDAKGLANSITQTATQLGISPNDLATVMSYETGGTFDPWQKGPVTKYGEHRGLIQWGEPQRQKYGVTADMPIEQQVAAAGQYLKDAGVKPGMGLLDIYSAINAGAPGLYDRSDYKAGGAPGTVADKVKYQMEGHKAKAAALLGGTYTPSANDPDLDAIPYNRRETLANWGEGEYTRQQNQQRQEARGYLETTVANAPAAIQNTGSYQNPMPTPAQFNLAYGPQEGAQRYELFRAAVETSQQAYKFQTMPESEITAALKGAEPKSSGDNAELEAKRYDSLTKAASETIRQREADPATYTQRAFPTVAQAWQDAATSGDYSSALSIMASTQSQLGIRNPQLLPKQIATGAIDRFKDEAAAGGDRLNAVAGLVFSTADQGQRQAVYKQLVDAGLPKTMDGVFEAMSRGDRGAANRLMEAVVADPAKLPNSKETTPAAITEGIYGDVWAPGEIGYTAYGLSYGDAASLERAQRGTELLNKAVRLRMARGEDLQASIDGAKKDLFGDKVVFTGRGSVHADLAVGPDVDQNALANGLEASKQAFRDVLTAQREKAIGGTQTGDDGEHVTEPGQRAILSAAAENRVNDILTNGVYVQTGNGIGLRDPYTGQFVAGADGKPMTITIEDAIKGGAKATMPVQIGTGGAASDIFSTTFDRIDEGGSQKPEVAR